MATNFCHKKLVTLISKQGNQLDRLYSQKSREIASVLKKYNLKDDRNVWKGNSKVEKEIEKILIGLDDSIKNYIRSNVSSANNLSNNCHDAIVESYIKGVDISPEQKALLFQRNSQALSAFQLAREKGLSLSSKVWNMDVQAKEQIEFFLKEGLANGNSAATIARDLKIFLKNPNKRFRRIKNEEGKLILSQPAKLYKPGSGVYRSSYKNALRLSQNEINIAYRNADHLRRQELDFVTGIRVNLSNAHPEYDICDELQGKYSKNFVFWGWHPNCLCFTTSILMSQKEFVSSLKNGNFDKSKQVSGIPKRAEKYLNKNSERIKSWKSKPYFISQNFKNVKNGLALKKSAMP